MSAPGPAIARCADCKQEHQHREMYLVCEPTDVRPTGAVAFLLCRSCWDRIIGNASLQAFR